MIDSADLLRAPEATLRALCAALDVPFDPAMLAWPAGRRDTDGVWAPHWYDSVSASTGFGPYREQDRAELPPELDRSRNAASLTTRKCPRTGSRTLTCWESPCCKSLMSATATSSSMSAAS